MVFTFFFQKVIFFYLQKSKDYSLKILRCEKFNVKLTLKGFFITKNDQTTFCYQLILWEKMCFICAWNECLEFSLHNGNITMDVMKIVGKKMELYKIDTFIGSVKKKFMKKCLKKIFCPCLMLFWRLLSILIAFNDNTSNSNTSNINF